MVWSIRKQENVITVKWEIEIMGHDKDVLCINWTNRSDKWLLSTSQDRSVKIWDINGKKEIATYRCHTDIVHCALFTSDDEHVVSVGVDKFIRVWKIVRDGDSYRTEDL